MSEESGGVALQYASDLASGLTTTCETSSGQSLDWASGTATLSVNYTCADVNKTSFYWIN